MADAKARHYSRSEMEALRNADAAEQRRKWNDLYLKLEPHVAKEYDRLEASGRRQRNKNGRDQQPARKKRKSLSSEVFNVDEYNYSSDECERIQKPAFFVEGEPDFELGPPLDGMEFLRRTRWEAAQSPKVIVAKPQSSKIRREQTPYMPIIPEITKCPPNLLPSKHWEDAFLADFAQLRQAISLHGESCGKQSAITNSKSNRWTRRRKKNNPSVSSVLSMDVLSRASELRDSISMLDAATSLAREDCLWLFLLCATVDSPPCAETCASLRCLLRKSSNLLALKSERDDEVAMLSILVAITGKYFGQSDSK